MAPAPTGTVLVTHSAQLHAEVHGRQAVSVVPVRCGDDGLAAEEGGVMELPHSDLQIVFSERCWFCGGYAKSEPCDTCHGKGALLTDAGREIVDLVVRFCEVGRDGSIRLKD